MGMEIAFGSMSMSRRRSRGGGPALLLANSIEHWQGLGQSLMVGTNGGPVVTLNPVSPMAGMIKLNVAGAYGPRPMEDQNPADPATNCDPSKLIGLTILREAMKGVDGETSMSGFVAQYTKNGFPNT